MKKRFILYCILTFVSHLCFAQSKEVWSITLLKQQKLKKWAVPGANYSGIAWLGGDSYAVVSDKEYKDGFYMFGIALDANTGHVQNVERKEFRGKNVTSTDANGVSLRDAEGIAFDGADKKVYISGEGDQRIIEYSSNGAETGRELIVPPLFNVSSIYPNYGFEALTFSAKDNLLWTVTEHTLKADGSKSSWQNPQGCLLRLLSFGTDMQLKRQYTYMTDSPMAKKPGRNYAFGVPSLCALRDGSLLVLEREFHVASSYLGSFVRCKIYRVVPNLSTSTTEVLHKELVADFTTKFNLIEQSLANYEGMCLGPQLADGSQTLLLISDSQNNAGNRFYRLKDYIKVIVIK